MGLAVVLAMLCGVGRVAADPKVPAVPPAHAPGMDVPLPSMPEPVTSSSTANSSSVQNGIRLGRWSLSFETSDLFATTQNPFLFLVKTRYEGPNPLNYRLATQVLSARYRITDPGGWSFLRGDWEASFGVMYSAILHGPEDYIVGALAGIRYNFVPRDSRLSPYIEMRLALTATNASKIFQGQQQNLTFGYLLGAGVRYQINDRWSASIGTLNQHESDLFMTDPNYGFNAMGVSASIERRF
ncbi:MAG: acyloxyacyl hydrolase [Alphaproteobacteria bacterium]